MKKFFTWVLVAFLFFYAIVFTDSAVAMCHGAWHATVTIAHGVGNFFDRLSGSKSNPT